MQKKWTVKHDCRELSTNEIIDVILEDRGIEDFNTLLYPDEECLVPFEAMKNIVKEYSKHYEICIQYDLIGMLEFKKSNKKTITCEDAIGEKVYIDEYKFNGLYSDDCIRLYERD